MAVRRLTRAVLNALQLQPSEVHFCDISHPQLLAADSEHAINIRACNWEMQVTGTCPNKFVEASAGVRKSSGATDLSPFLAVLTAHPAVPLAKVRHWHQEERKRIVKAKARGLLNTA